MSMDGSVRWLCCLAAMALLGGCSKPKPPPAPSTMPAPAEIRDLTDLPQDCLAYLDAATASEPLIPAESQKLWLQYFRRNLFYPWHEGAAAASREPVLQVFDRFGRSPGFGENYQPYGPERAEALREAAGMESFPNFGKRGITIRNSSLRGMPTLQPRFDGRPDMPGSGYPFDTLQSSAVWANSPVYVCHLSRDGSWAYIRARFAAGWMPAEDVAWIDDPFLAEWERARLAAVVQDGTAVADVDGRYRFTTHIGAVLPLVGPVEQESLECLAAVADENGKARIVHVVLGKDRLAEVPLEPTARNVAVIADRMLGQPYGWGGMYEYRDCSATLRDLFLPLGLDLPRNSEPQGKAGKVVLLANMTGRQKEQMILDKGQPFLTLLHAPGHIMLYIGQRNGRAIILHNFWGVRLRLADGAVGRKVVGRCAITTLQPGIERPDVLLPKGDMRELIDAMVLLSPRAEVPNELD